MFMCYQNFGISPSLVFPRIIRLIRGAGAANTNFGVLVSARFWVQNFFWWELGPHILAASQFFYVQLGQMPLVCKKISKKLMPRQFSASWNNARFWHIIPGRRKLARVDFFWNFLALSGHYRNFMRAYLPGPKIWGQKSQKWTKYSPNSARA